MGADTTGRPPASRFAGLLNRPRHPGITVGIGLLLTLAPFGAAALDGVLGIFLGSGLWHFSLLPAVVILYILIISPIMARADIGVVDALRPLVLLDDDSFDQLVADASHLNPAAEILAFGAGAAFGAWQGRDWLAETGFFWLGLYVPLSAALMFGLLGWTIYAAVYTTRVTMVLNRQPMRIDIFDTEPFRPIGRQSLVSALAFIGGIVLAIIFGMSWESISDWRNWILFFLLALVPVLIFFLNMRDTHRVLAAEKNRELEAVQQNIHRACRILMERVTGNESSGTLAAEINALVAYEERVQQASTWPYDTAQLRTLFVSVIIPVGAAVGRAVSELFFE